MATICMGKYKNKIMDFSNAILTGCPISDCGILKGRIHFIFFFENLPLIWPDGNCLVKSDN